jgi:hypothetical protein
MGKARPPVVKIVTPSVIGSAQNTQMAVSYPDQRIKPRICERTGTVRARCWCEPCRKLRRRKHRAHCSCSLCLCDRMGQMVDRLGGRTFAGRWLWFITMTFRTADHRWQHGFPMLQFRPDEDFVNHFFERAITRIEHEAGGPAEYFLAHQFGSQNGRLHLHFGVSWPDTLFEWKWKAFQEWVWRKAGFIRILPWQQAAAFYLSRYIGRSIGDCHWDFRVGLERVPKPVSVGRQVVAVSANVSSANYHRVLNRWHR